MSKPSFRVFFMLTTAQAKIAWLERYRSSIKNERDKDFVQLQNKRIDSLIKSMRE